MRKTVLALFLLIAFTGLASAGTYTVKWVNVKTVNDTLNLNFVSTVSNATLTVSEHLDNSGGGTWKRVDVFPFSAATTTDAQYCVQINGNWINVTNSTGALKASLYDPLFWDYVSSTGDDIRFANQTSQLYFWIQDFNATAQTATIWVNISAGSSELRLYYGNSLALQSSYENGSKVFLFFDDFNTLDTKWNTTGYATFPGATITVSGGVAHINTSLATWASFHSYYTISSTSSVVIEAKEKLLSLNGQEHALFLLSSDNADTNRFGIREDGAATSLNTLQIQDEIAGTYYYPATLIDVGNDWYIAKIIKWNSTHFTGIAEQNGVEAEGSANSATWSTVSWWIGGFTETSAGFDIDWIFVASLADPATFGTPAAENNTINVTVGTYSAQVSSASVAIPSTAFSTITVVKITSDFAINATLTFDYAYSSTSTIIDTGTVIEKNFSINTTGLTVPITLNVTFPLRTKAYKLFVNVSPSTTITNTTTNTSLITSYILQNNTTYTIDEKIGYLIANFTGKDELTGSSLTSITVNYTSLTGWKSSSGATVSIYGTDIPLHQTETVIEFSSAGYSSRHYILDCTKLNQSITLYLLADSASTMITYTVVSGTSTLSNAKVEIYKYIGDQWVLIDSQYTDASGVVAVPLHAFDTYKITASKPGYDTVTATITVTQATYTIKLGGVSLAIPASHRAVIMFKPSQSTLQPGNNTISVEVIPQGTTVTTATMTVYVNSTPVATVTKSDITAPTTLSTTVNLNQSSSVSVEVSYVENGQTITTRKNYTVPLATGVWAALLLMNQQLAQTQNGHAIGMLIAAFIALAVVAGLAATTNTTARGLGLVGLIVFTIIALPLNAISLNILIVVWVAVLASWVVWRWI